MVIISPDIYERATVLIAITDTDLGDASIERSVLDGFDVELLQSRAPEELAARAQQADGLLVQWAPIDADLMDQLPQLRSIVRYGIGLDNIDLAAAQARGIRVHNVPDYCIEEVAHHTAALITTRARRITDYNRLTKGARWTVTETSAPLRPSQDPIGLMGLGRIGLTTAEMLRGFGHPILAWDPYRTEWPAWITAVEDPLELATRANHLSLHIPHTPETDKIVNLDVLRALGPDGHLVNTARGGLVDEEALLVALDEGIVGFASLDVFRTEPPVRSAARLAAHARVVATPHAAYLSTESKLALQRRAAEIMRDSLEVTSAP